MRKGPLLTSNNKSKLKLHHPRNHFSSIKSNVPYSLHKQQPHTKLYHQRFLPQSNLLSIQSLIPTIIPFRTMSTKKVSIDDDSITASSTSSKSTTTSTSWLTKSTKSTTPLSIPPSKLAIKRKQAPQSSSSSSTSSSSSSSGSSTSSSTDSSSSSSSSSSDSDIDDSKRQKKSKATNKSTKTPTKRAKSTTTTTTTTKTTKSTTKNKTKSDITLVDIEDYDSLRLSSNISTLTPQQIKTICQYLLIRHMRHDVNSPAYNAPVDTMGCSMTGNRDADPKVFRFETLVSLMLSSQTKDAITYDAVTNLRTKLTGGCTPRGILSQPDIVAQCIAKVGFHNTKLTNLIKTAEICQNKYNSDIPRTLQELLALPGVGPKMSHLALQAAWNDQTTGIGIDTHVHRITNQLNWVDASTAEKTRIALEKVLPKQLYSEINWLLVGFGQSVCKSRSPNCNNCALGKLTLCPASTIKTTARKELDEYIKDMIIQQPTLANESKQVLKSLAIDNKLMNEYGITQQSIQNFFTSPPPPNPGQINNNNNNNNNVDNDANNNTKKTPKH